MEALPEPFSLAAKIGIGPEYNEYQQQAMPSRNIALAKTYKLFHDPSCTDADIQQLRELHAEMYRSILASYGLSGLDPQHGLHRNERGQRRFTVAPAACLDILHRLLELNLRLGQGD